jgi:hypothetical protein
MKSSQSTKPYKLLRIFLLFAIVILPSCRNRDQDIDIGILNATRYPAIPVSQETVDAMKRLRELATPAPAPTRSALDMKADDPTDFHLAAGQYQFIEFFRYG